MNKLVIIGNGFDFAHGLKTSYKDFVLWYLNKRYGHNQSYSENVLLSFIDVNPFDSKFESLDDFNARIKYERIKVEYHFDFFKSIIEDFKISKWVDIESLYYSQLVLLCRVKIGELNYNLDHEKNLKELNECFSILKNELEEYLHTISNQEIKVHNQILYSLENELIEEINKNDSIVRHYKKTMFLNFNYTSTIWSYLKCHSFNSQDFDYIVNSIHGRIKDENNPIIFGYGDETDKYYEKIEDLNDNSFTFHFKSKDYFKTKNYQNLFRFIESDEFEVCIFGHSLGISDRVLLGSIFEQDNLKKIRVYYYQKSDVENDFSEKMQEISRHFKANSKHKMKLLIEPFSPEMGITTKQLVI